MDLSPRSALRRQVRRQLNPALNLNLDLSLGHSLHAAFGLAKYDSSFIRKYPQTCRKLYGVLCRQVCRKLCPELNLNLNFGLNLNLNLNLNSRSYPSLFRQMLAALFDSMLESKYAQLLALSHLALRRQKLPPRRPLDRGVGDRIVVGNGLTTTYRRRPVRLLCPLASRRGRLSPAPDLHAVCWLLPTSPRALARDDRFLHRPEARRVETQEVDSGREHAGVDSGFVAARCYFAFA